MIQQTLHCMTAARIGEVYRCMPEIIQQDIGPWWHEQPLLLVVPAWYQLGTHAVELGTSCSAAMMAGGRMSLSGTASSSGVACCMCQPMMGLKAEADHVPCCNIASLQAIASQLLTGPAHCLHPQAHYCLTRPDELNSGCLQYNVAPSK